MTHEEKRKLIGRSYDIAYRFSTELYKKFPGVIKSVVLFGSVAKKTIDRESDVDILVVFDDTSLEPRRNFIDWYNIEISKIIQRVDSKLHVNTVTLSTFWENVKTGEPVAINVLRYGVALIDTGFFEPLQIMLRQGRIRPTPESVWNYFVRAPESIHNANWHILKALSDLYWAVIDSAHAVLMNVGEIPPAPEKVGEILKEKFCNKGLLEKKYSKTTKYFE